MDFSRDNILCKEIVFVDGMSGTGKSILSPILASFERVEKMRFYGNIEKTSIMANYGKITTKNASLLINLMADEALFNTMISRETNLRPKDDSGILNNPKAWMYIKRLLKPGNDQVVDEIKQKSPVLHIVSHNLLQVSKPVFEAFGEDLSLITMVRHPVYMIEHWYNYVERFGTDPREFNLTVGEKGMTPWFAGDIDNYLSLSRMDKVIYGCENLLIMHEKALAKLSFKEKERLILVPFESFVIDPLIWVEQLTKFLNTRTTKATSRILKKQKCPREFINAGKGHSHYGFNKKNAQLSETDDYDRRMTFIHEKASTEALIVLKRIAKNYENKYIFTRKMPWEM